MTGRGLYLHIPFCKQKCAYCDFYSLAGKENLIGPFLKSLLKEAAVYRGMSFNTVYIGGGTPSLLGGERLVKLVSGLSKLFDLSGVAEFTLEANPESVNSRLLSAAIGAGVNRLSLGVQSLSGYELRTAGRVHDCGQALAAIEGAVDAGFTDISADLIIGLPGQDEKSLLGTLGKLACYPLTHLSLYCLSLEAGTPMHASPPMDLPDEDAQAGLFEAAALFLSEKGFIHYEISNFSKQGHECRHNLNYWRGGEYLGLGPAAASYLNGKRSKNRSDLSAYMHEPRGQATENETLSGAEKAGELAMLRLRLLEEGLPLSLLRGNFSPVELQGLLKQLDKLAEEKLLLFDGETYRIPGERVLTSSPILARVIGGQG